MTLSHFLGEVILQAYFARVHNEKAVPSFRVSVAWTKLQSELRFRRAFETALTSARKGVC